LWALTAAVFFISIAALMFQLLQSVTLSLQVIHTTAFLVISLAMFGLGAGGSLANVLMRRGMARSLRWLWSITLVVGVIMLGAGILGSRFSSLEVLILIGFFPYLAVGLMLSVIFQRWPEHAGRIYCFDLVGAGIGCLGLVWALDGLGDAGVVQLLIAEFAVLGALCLAVPLSRRAVVTTGAIAIGIAALVPMSDQLFVYLPSPYKPYGRILRSAEMQSTLDWSKWGYLGRLDSVVPGRGIQDYAYAGEWVRDTDGTGSESRMLFANGGNWATAIDFKEDDAYRARFLRQAVPAAPYIFFTDPDVLNVGVGGGVDVFLALGSGARSVVGVEINPLMIEALRRHPEFFDDPAGDPRVTIREIDGRTFVDGTTDRFDVITITAVDTGAAVSAGPYVLSENYLYTREALDAYLRLLRDDGVLFVYRPARDILRVLATATASLRALKVEDPENHFAIFGGSRWIGAIVARSPLPPGRADLLSQRLARGDFGGNTYFIPGVGNTLFEPFIDAVAEERESEFLRSLPLKLSPTVDDRPFFYDYDHDLLTGEAGRLLLGILYLLVPGAVALILVPLIGMRVPGGSRIWMPTLGYVACIGVGFMFIEIALVQKLVLFLGHPAYSLTVTLFSILIFSGLGSLVVDRASHPSARFVTVCLSSIVLVSIFYAGGLQPLLERLQVQSLLGRAVTAAALLAPGSMLMGMPFPSIIRRLGRDRRPLISWAWAINGFASVIASVVAVMISMKWGFSSTLVAGSLCYLGAAGCFLLLRGERSS
jgi:SAM-dependent methyltransferase